MKEENEQEIYMVSEKSHMLYPSLSFSPELQILKASRCWARLLGYPHRSPSWKCPWINFLSFTRQNSIPIFPSGFWTTWVSNLSPLLLSLHSALLTLNPSPPFASTAALSSTSALSCLFPLPAPGLDLPLGLLLPSLSYCQSPAGPHIRLLSELSQHMLLTPTDLNTNLST